MQVERRRTSAARPSARFEELVVTETADEVLLYNTEKHHIHHLNATTAAVWRHCDGKQTVGDLARLAGQELGASVDEATVRLALTKLDDAGLLQASLADELRMSRMSRRTFMQRAGVAGAIAVPALVSTTAAVGASFSEPICGEACDPLAGRNCVEPNCTGCLSGVCVTDVVACTYVNSGYKSIPCDNSGQCHAAFDNGTFVRPPGATNENCSGSGQVPGLGKGCCVGNNESGPATCGVTPCPDSAQCLTWFGAGCGTCLPTGVCGPAEENLIQSQSLETNALDQNQVDETQETPTETQVPETEVPSTETEVPSTETQVPAGNSDQTVNSNGVDNSLGAAGGPPVDETPTETPTETVEEDPAT